MRKQIIAVQLVACLPFIPHNLNNPELSGKEHDAVETFDR